MEQVKMNGFSLNITYKDQVPRQPLGSRIGSIFSRIAPIALGSCEGCG